MGLPGKGPGGALTRPRGEAGLQLSILEEPETFSGPCPCVEADSFLAPDHRKTGGTPGARLNRAWKPGPALRVPLGPRSLLCRRAKCSVNTEE